MSQPHVHVRAKQWTGAHPTPSVTPFGGAAASVKDRNDELTMRNDVRRVAVISLTLPLLMSLLGCDRRGSQGTSDATQSGDVVEIGAILAKAIPRATSMTPAEFVEMVSGTGNVDGIRNKSLTYALLSLDMKQPHQDLRFEPGGMGPDALTNHIVREDKEGIATLIHSENVERVDTLFEADGKVVGCVRFSVPRFVKGLFLFRALKGREGRWRFEELILVGSRQQLRQAEEGRWTIDQLSGEEVERWNTVRKKFCQGE